MVKYVDGLQKVRHGKQREEIIHKTSTHQLSFLHTEGQGSKNNVILVECGIMNIVNLEE